MRPIDIILVIIAIGLFVYYIIDTKKSIEKIEKYIGDVSFKTIKTNNGCDICCKECQDNDVCVGACVHCKKQGDDEQ